MTTFVNQNELIIMVLSILLFDLTIFCDLTMNYLKNKPDYLLFYTSLIFILFDTRILNFIINDTSYHDGVTYKVIDENTESIPPENKLINSTNQENKTNTKQYMENIIFVFIILVFIMLLLIRNKNTYNLLIKVPIGLSIIPFVYYIFKH